MSKNTYYLAQCEYFHPKYSQNVKTPFSRKKSQTHKAHKYIGLALISFDMDFLKLIICSDNKLADK